MRSFDRDDLLDLYELRALLEPRRGARCAAHAPSAERARASGGAPTAPCDAPEDQIALNEEFHRIILEAAGSPRLEVAMRAATGIPRTFRSVFWHDERQRASR